MKRDADQDGGVFRDRAEWTWWGEKSGALGWRFLGRAACVVSNGSVAYGHWAWLPRRSARPLNLSQPDRKRL